MKSLHLQILFWCFATLALSLLTFSGVSRFVEARAMGKSGPLARVDAMILRQATEAYEFGGAAQLAEYLERTNQALGDPRYLTDPQGRDLASGADRSDLLNSVHTQWASPVPKDGHLIVALAAADNRYRLITVLNPPFAPWTLLPYYALIIAAVALVCWALAVSIVSPLRNLARSVELFGRGDLAVRLNSSRRDEIGDLARSFDLMAERISALLAAERRLLQDVSHELRSPLARMSFAAELARREDKREAAIARIKSEIDRLSDLIASLLEVTRAETDPAVKQHEFSIVDLLQEIAGDCWIEADAQRCRVVLDASGDSGLIGNRELLRRAFENIVRNAIRYTPSDSCIEVRVESRAQMCRVSIRDYGVGVPVDFLEKLGQPFVRVDDSRNSSTGGVGLGLAIAKRAIGLHHGSLQLRNVHPGLEVTINLPMPPA
jgi:two-component system sensor histidine kinase CpxA